jgi:hypothetical protein
MRLSHHVLLPAKPAPLSLRAAKDTCFGEFPDALPLISLSAAQNDTEPVELRLRTVTNCAPADEGQFAIFS